MVDANAGPPGPTVNALEGLLKEADSASRHVNTVHLTFLLFAAYVLVTIASTTHEQLLRIDPVTLPLLNVSVPVLGFYLVVPWLVLLFHFNLLLQLYLLSRKLFSLDARLTGLSVGSAAEQRVLLFPFPFTNMLVGRHRRLVHVLLTLMVTVTFVVIPLALLIGAQIAFLPFHSVPVTAFQRLAVHLDLAMLWILWPMIVTPSGSGGEWWRAAISLMKARGLALTGALTRALGGLRRRLKKVPAPRVRFQPPSSVTTGSSPWLATLVLAMVGTISLSFLTAVLPGEALELWIARVMPERWVVREGTCPDGCWAVTHWVFDSWEAPFPRNLRLANAVLVGGEVPPATLTRLKARPTTRHYPLTVRDFALAERKKDVETIQGLDLTNRDLRFADLRGAVLVNADLRGANLTGADLRGTDLSAADLSPFDTREGERCLFPPMKPPIYLEHGVMEAPACRTMLWKAKLSSALLPWAHLEHADLREATATAVVLVEARSEYAHFEGADLTDAVLYRADLDHASFQRANLRETDFRLADLIGAFFQGADLGGARLHGANLWIATFDGAWFRNTGLRAVRAEKASFRGADLRFADLTAAYLAYADFKGADLREARITGAVFRDADLSWADLRQLWRKPSSQVLESDKIGEEGDLDEIQPQLARIDKPDTLAEAAKAVRALCDDGKVHAGCLSEDQLELYGAGVSPLLARLGCADGDVAAGLVRRLWVRNGANYDRIEWSSIAEDVLAKALLDPRCKSSSTLASPARWLLQRAARGLPTPPWMVPREIVFPTGNYRNLLDLFPLNRSPGKSYRITHIWHTESPVTAVAEYYRSQPVRGVWRIEPVSEGAAAPVIFRVSRRDDPSRTFATITVSPLPKGDRQRAKIEIALHDLHAPSEVPPGVSD
jgi:uncharacterized protein YjbI with pentapeptide repeats